MKNKNNKYNNYEDYNDQNYNDFDLIFNKIVEVNNSGNQQIFNLISSVEGNLSNQIADIKSFLSSNRGNNTNSNFWPNYTTMQQPIISPIPIQQPSIQHIVDPSTNSQISNLSIQFDNLRKEINDNKELIKKISNNGLGIDSMSIINETNNKNADQLHSALNYLQNNILNSIDNQSAINYDFGESLALLREEIYSSQNALLEAVRLNYSGNNGEQFQSLYDEITKVNDDNTQNLFNYISQIEENLNNNFYSQTIQSNNDINNRISDLDIGIYNNLYSLDNNLNNKISDLDIGINNNLYNLDNRISDLDIGINNNLYNLDNNLNNRISDLENRIYESHDINSNINYSLMDKVDESSMIYHDLLANLREELLISNNQNFEEIINVASQLRNELMESDYHNTSSLYEHTNTLQEESSHKLSYLNDQIETIKQMLYNLNDLIGINNDRFKNELNKINSSNSLEDSKYREELNSIKELLKEKNMLLENYQKLGDNPNIEIDDGNSIDKKIEKILNEKNRSNNEIEKVSWDDWEEELDYIDEEDDYMENYKSNGRRRQNRIDESKLDMIYERVEQINYEINSKLFELERNIFNLINDRENEINYKIIESNKINEKLIFDSIDNLSQEFDENNKSIKKDFLEQITEIKEEFIEKNKETISNWDNKLKISIDEMNQISSNIIDEMIESQKRFDDIFKNIDSRLASFEQELINTNENQINIYGENHNNFEKLFYSLEKHKKDIKKTHLMWDENNEKIESIKERINQNSKEIKKISINENYQEILESLGEIDNLKKNNEDLKTELAEIKNTNLEIENKLVSGKEGIEEKLNILYNDFQFLLESLDEKIQFDIANASENLNKKLLETSESNSSSILDETSKKIDTLESQIDASSNKLEIKINEVNDEINSILNNLDNKIQKETEQKLKDLYDQTIQLVNNVQLENEHSKNQIEETNNYIFDRINEYNEKIFHLENIANVNDENFSDLSQKINDIKKINFDELSDDFKKLHESWLKNNDKLKVLEDVLLNQSLEIQNLSSMSQEAFDDSYDRIKVLYDNEAKIKEEINQIQSNNSILENKIFKEKELLEDKIDNVSSNIDSMISDLDNRVNEKTDSKIVKLYDETIEMISQLKEENKNSYEEISLVNESFSLNLFEVNSKIAELEHLSKLEPENDSRFKNLFETISEMKNISIKSKEDVELLMDHWNLNNEKIINLETILEERSNEILALSENATISFDDAYSKIEHLYKSEDLIKNEILAINAINEELEKKLISEKKKLDEKIKILNDELSSKIISSEERIISSTDDKIKDLSVDLDSKLVSLHNEVMNLIGELNETNQEMNEQISLIENDTIRSFYSIDEKIFELTKLNKEISANDPKYVEIMKVINDIKNDSESHSNKILSLQNKLNKNIERSKSLKKILVAQSEEIQFIATSSNEAINSSFDRIQELFNSEKNIKDEIEKIYSENKSIKDKIEEEKKVIVDKLNVATNDLEEKINVSEEKTNLKLNEMHFELLDQINTIHYENVANVEKISNLELIFKAEINANKEKLEELEKIVNQVPEEDPKFNLIFNEISELKEFSIVSIDKMQEHYDLINKNNENILTLKSTLDNQGQDIIFLSQKQDEDFIIVHDRIQELYESENSIKEEIEKIYFENSKLKKIIFNESNKNKQNINSKIIEIQNMLDNSENKIFDKIEKDKNILESMIKDSEENILDQTNKKIDILKEDIEEKLNSLYSETMSLISEISEGNQSLVDEINNLDNFTRISLMTIDSKISEIDFLVNQIPEEDPKFQKFIYDIESLKSFNETTLFEIQKIYDSWKANNNKLASLEDILMSQSEEIKALSASNEEVWNLSFDRIQELYESENKIKEEIELIFSENNNIKSQFIEEKEKIQNKLKDINENILVEINKTKDDVLTKMDDKFVQINDDIQEKVNKLYSEITNIISEVHSFNEMNSSQIFALKDEVNNFVIETNNKIFEINEVMALLPEEDPKFKDLFLEVELLRKDNDTSMYEIQKIYDSWKVNNNKLASLEDILMSQSEELKALSASNEEVWNLSFDRIQELYESENKIKEEIELIFSENNNIKSQFIEEKEKLQNKIKDINENILVEINKTKDDVLTKMDDKFVQINDDIQEKVNKLYSEITNIISEVHSFNEMNSSQIFALKDEVNNFVIETNNKIFEINEVMALLPEEDPKFKDLFLKVELLRKDNDTSMYEIQKIYDSWKVNNNKLASLEDILMSQSEELKALSASNEEVWNLSFDRIQELYESENKIKEEIELIFSENNNIKSQFIEEKEKLQNKIKDINENILVEINKTKDDVLTKMDDKFVQINDEIQEKVNKLYSEITNIISEVHSFNEMNSSQIFALKDEVNNFIIETNNKIFEINEVMALLPEEDPKFKDLFLEVELLRKDNDTSMYEIQKIYDSWKVNNNKLASLEEILMSQSEELKALSASNEEVWNLSFDRIQELYESENKIKEEIELIYSETDSIKNKLKSHKDKVKDRIKDIDNEIKNKLSSLEIDLNNKIDSEINNLSNSINSQMNERLDIILNQTLQLIEDVKYANEESNNKFQKVNDLVRHELDTCNEHILFLENRINENTNLNNSEFEKRINEIKELNVNVNNEIEKNKKLWLLNNFKLNSFRDLLNSQAKEIDSINNEYEPSDELKRKIDDLLEIDQSLKSEINEILNSNSKIEKNIQHQKTILMNKVTELLDSSNTNLNEKFNEKIEGVYNQSMEMINIINDTVHENKQSFDIVHNLINNNYESVNDKIQKLVIDVNSKFDEKIGLEKINELASVNNSISKEILRIQKDWHLNNEKLNSLIKMLNEQMEKQNLNINDINYSSKSIQDNLIDLLELDGSISNEIESLKNKNLILEDNLFNFKKDFEDNIKEIINQIDLKIDSISQVDLFSNEKTAKYIEEIVYGIVTKEIQNIPFKDELLKLTEEDNKIKEQVNEMYKKISDKNFKISQLIFDEIWNCNLKIESLIDEVMNIINNSKINDLKKYVVSSNNEIKKSYKSWIANEQKINLLEGQINKISLLNSEENNNKILNMKSEINSLEFQNNEINNKIAEIIKKQEISTENLYNEILGIINNLDLELHKKIDEKLKNFDFAIDPNISDKEEVKKIVQKYVEEIISSELKEFIKLFEENNNELNNSHKAWLANNQRISLLEDIVIEHEKGIKKTQLNKYNDKDFSLSKNEKESIEKLIAKHKKRLL